MKVDELFEIIEEERMIGDQLIKFNMYHCKAGCGYKTKNVVNEKKRDCPGCLHKRQALSERDKIITAVYGGGAPARSMKEKGNYKEVDRDDSE